MGTRTTWSKQDTYNSMVEQAVSVKSLMEENRYGFFVLMESTYKQMTNMDVANMFSKVVPFEMRPMVYENDVNVLEILCLSSYFRGLGVGEDPPFYDIRNMEEMK